MNSATNTQETDDVQSEIGATANAEVLQGALGVCQGRIRRKKSSIAQPNLFCEGKAGHQSSEHVILVFGQKLVVLPG
jgi:hypothetical protein